MSTVWKRWVDIMKKCPYCSAEILDESEFCMHCMHQLTPKTLILSTKRKPKILVPVLLIAIALIIFTVILMCKNHLPKKNDTNNSAKATSGASSDTISNDEKENGLVADNSTPTQSNTVPDNSPTDNTSTSTGDTTFGEKPGANPPLNESGSGETAPSPSKPQTEPEKEDKPEQPSDEVIVAPEKPGNEQEILVWSTKEVAGGIEIIGIENYIDNGIYEIPSQIDGKTVVGIANSAFYYEQGIKSITLPDTLQYINDQAFAYCNSLTQIIIPASVRKIGTNAFLPCENLADVYIKSTNISIANYAFSSSYQRNVSLTIHAPFGVVDATNASLFWGAKYEEWNG